MHDFHFPNESPNYRSARNQLLEAERELRRRVEAVASLRRQLPVGGLVPTDYLFEEGGGDGAGIKTVALSQLFAPGKDTLVLYSYMFGPAMTEPCHMCTPFLDGLNGNARHLAQRVNLAVVAKSPLPRIRQLAWSRGWRDLRLLSSENNTFNRDYFGEDKDGDQNSIIHVFVRKPDGIHHFYSSEMNFLPPDPKQNPRHIDMMWPLWNVLDLTPDGRGTDWFPSLAY
jgi:predicted dithiol-disulfide oxidoreductase (DUF899 family)